MYNILTLGDTLTADLYRNYTLSDTYIKKIKLSLYNTLILSDTLEDAHTYTSQELTLIYISSYNTLTHSDTLTLGDTLTGDTYINMTIAGVLEIVALVLSCFALQRIGRRWPIAVLLVSGGVACLICAAIPDG